ncbi:hypothetical protein [Mangrovibacterium diazotrophicum]|uniref:Uncharacterized protein n=1 Tax=Mangrovibacterium diazotrophicum TaxID=1261403 RepID=A0A419VV46_9BACT|nr:hypothetical protein [Mangrovibacterium diazotrophicum]RKD86003.1 hypothetical protein BC643_4319 [Mangrovibacterium diazotrophicum]
MKKRHINTIDVLIERLSESFAKIKNFNILQESEEGRRLFDLIVKSSSELENFQTLFLNYYIPASNKSIVDSWNQVKTSKYKHLINISKDELKDNLYETIRLGYVGLFHKYESYLKSLVDAVNFLLKELNDENNLMSIEDYCKKEFKINIFKSHHLFPITERINYISNCIKHWDGYPVKEPIILDFKYSDPNKKIQIESEEFKSDIERLKSHCQLLLSQIMMIGFKQYFELDYLTIKESLKPEIKENEETKEKIEQAMKNIDFILSDFKK